MKWNEFRALLVGIGPETPLGRIVEIRAEEDKETLKHFTRDQKRIRNEWKSRKVKEVSKEEMDKVLEDLKQAFISWSGGGQN